MKRFDEYTTEEMAQCTEEELQNLIDLEIAFAGIKPVLPVSKTESKEKIEEIVKPTVEAYCCHGITFLNQEDAILFSNMKIKKQTYKYNIGGNYVYLQDYTQYDNKGVTKEFFYNEDDLEQVKNQLLNIKKIKDKINEQKKEFEKFVSDTEEIRETVYDYYDDAIEFMREVKNAQEIYNKYLSLASGDEKIAKKFMKDAYAANLEILHKIIGDQECEG